MNATRQTLKIYWQHVWRYPKYTLGILVFIPLGQLTFRLIPPLITATIINRLSMGHFAHGKVWEYFGFLLIAYSVSVSFGGIVALRVVEYCDWKLETYVIKDLYMLMFSKLISLDAGFHANSFSGSLVSRTSKFANAFGRLKDSLIYQFYGMITTFGFVMIIMYKRSPLFVWSLLVFSIIFTTTTFFLSKRVRHLAALQATAENRQTGSLADSVTNVPAVKSFAASKREKVRFESATEFTRKRGIDEMWATIIRDFVSSIINAAIQIVAVVLAVIAVVDHNADVATVFLIFSYTASMADQLWNFGSSTLRNINRSLGDAQEGVRTLATEPAVKDPAEPEAAHISKGAVELRTMVFDHEGVNISEDALFHNFNLSVKAGEKIGLVGRSGSGKTTLTKLILRFMDIDSGAILIDGQNIAKITQDDLRSSITYVPQEPLLFHRSLTENISYGKPDATEEEIVRAAKLAHAHEFIKELPKGYETLVGERGVKLSGGQRQRVAIARAMLKEAPLLLLDEATSALDSESEVLIQDALWKLMIDKTAIVIAHRLSTIQKMDRIVVLDNGQIVEAGSHQELLTHGGTYAKLWAHQSGGFLEE